ncbi:MAG: UDP-N-acetylmuramate--L-alanine ligase [Bernardetiaceae bacterium]|nr:UDP-N-acetylmuramate--L-alanine ligase [Bernardetiaceae bacterium]
MANIRFVYFIGIGGIGMSNLARWCKANGYEVAGYDRTATPLTAALQAEGMDIHFADDVALIPAPFLENPKATLVVYTPAVPKDHRELNYLIANGFDCRKRAAVLGLIANAMRCLAVAGTHGKTSTSSTLAHLIYHSGTDCAAFLGGITQNYQTNFLLNRGEAAQAWAVVEADEYDRSFLHLQPLAAVITSTDADHLDIYGKADRLLESFTDFGKQVKSFLLLHESAQVREADLANAEVWRYDAQTAAGLDVWAENIRVANGRTVFDWVVRGKTILKDAVLAVPGMHSLNNALAALTLAWKVAGIAPESLREALASYKGVKRRFEICIETDELVYVDDYAHHPTEIDAFIAAMRMRYPNRHLTVVFQPHLFSRTRDFAAGFSESLSRADRLILLPIYPARELPMEGVTSELIFRHATVQDKHLITEQELLPMLRQLNIDLLATVGAGDIDRFVPQITETFTLKTV